MKLIKTEIFKKVISQPGDLLFAVQFIKPLLKIKSCVLLSGDLAAGKTTFVNIFCETYDLFNVTSPTFALHQVYSNQLIKIDHFDLYRLETADEIETAGLWDVMSQKKGLVFIEWAQRISVQDLPLDWFILEIDLMKLSETKRFISISQISLG